MKITTPLLICVVGPTAIGKTRLGIELANIFNTEIISADSRQFFKEMAIGTAVPSKEELAAATHHFIQHKSIFENYSVGDFEKEAIAKLSELFQKHQIVILVGGSGLYVDAVVKGLDYFPEVPETIRAQLNTELNTNGLQPLQEELKKVDLQYASEVDLNNPQRVIRALEVYRASQKPFSSFRNKSKTKRDFDTLYIGLQTDRETIYERINVRVKKMIASGLVEEAKALLPHKDLNALQTVGYRELFAYFEDDNSTLDEAISEIQKNTRRFAKRQGTWFRKNKEILWFDYLESVATIASTIKKALSQ